MKPLTFATYWLLVVAVIGGVSSCEQRPEAEPEAISKAVSFSFNGVDCDVVRDSGEIAGVAGMHCVRPKER